MCGFVSWAYVICYVLMIINDRSSQVVIITYIIAWALIHERGYQEASSVESSVITKVKGTTSSYLDKESDSILNNR